MLFPFLQNIREGFYFLTLWLIVEYFTLPFFQIYIMVKAEELKERGFTSKGFSGEWILNKKYTTFIVILGKYESIEVYKHGTMSCAFPINSIHHIDEVVYLN